MASAFTHAFLGLALGKIVFTREVPTRFWVLSAVCAVLPDFDVVAFFFGIPYEDMFGHRGVSHSLAFAGVVGVTVSYFCFRGSTLNLKSLALYFFIVTASHGALDAMTDGGHGVAFFAPFDDTRYFFPYRPLVVSPIGIASFFSTWGWEVIKSEFTWVWIPTLIALGILQNRLR
jgi:inner membrane protein